MSLLLSVYQKIRELISCINDSSKLDTRITVGEGTYGIFQNTVLLFRDDDSVKIGKYCCIASGVKILASGEHNYRAVANYPFAANMLGDINRDTFKKGLVVIGNDVWIGANATLLSGVQIGDGAVIGAGSVVIGNIPSYSIVAGVPARIIKYRFPEEIIIELQSILWWDWGYERIRNNLELFYLPIDQFIIKAKSVI